MLNDYKRGCGKLFLIFPEDIYTHTISSTIIDRVQFLEHEHDGSI